MSLDAEALFQRAKAALVAGNAAAAATAARQVVLLAPGAWPALYLLAVAERDSGATDAARRAFEAALKAAPGHPDILYDYAGMLDVAGERAAAIARYREVIAVQPDHLGAWTRLSVALTGGGALGEAHKAILAATRLAPQEAEVWFIMGANRHEAGDAEGAADALERALALAPDDVGVLRALAELETDRSGSGLALFRRAAELAPNDLGTAMSLALARHQAGETAEAIDALLDLARRRPGWTVPLQNAAKIAVTDGRPEAARAIFTEALEARPTDSGLWYAYLQMLAQHEDYASVLTAAEAARGRLGDFPALQAFIAVALDETGDHAQASEMLERLDASHAFPSIVDGRVRNLLRTGRIEEAAQRAAAGVGQDGRRRLWAYLATAWRMLGDPRSRWLEAPEFVQTVEVEDGVALAEAAAPALRALHTARAAPLGQTVRGGSQTDGQLFLRNEPEIRRLGAALQRAVEAYAAGLPPIEAGHPLLEVSRDHIRLSGWSVRLPSGGLHVNHIHPEGWLSSAFYVNLPELTPGTTEGWLAIGEPPKELKLDLEPYRLIEPKPGRLALFPSYTWHGTRLFGGGGERLTVAFDVMTG